MADINSAPGSESHMKAVQAIEAAAVVDTSGPLPLTVPTLAYIPAERRQNYKRLMDGSFALRFISRDDEESLTAYQENIASGKLPVLMPGETPETVAERGKVSALRAQAVLDQANREEATEREARRNAAHAAQVGEVNKRFGR